MVNSLKLDLIQNNEYSIYLGRIDGTTVFNPVHGAASFPYYSKGIFEAGVGGWGGTCPVQEARRSLKCRRSEHAFCLRQLIGKFWCMLIRAHSRLLRISTHSSYLSALLCCLHLFFYVLDCEILHLLFHLKLFQSGWWLSQWLFSSVHLEENISFLKK